MKRVRSYLHPEARSRKMADTPKCKEGLPREYKHGLTLCPSRCIHAYIRNETAG